MESIVNQFAQVGSSDAGKTVIPDITFNTIDKLKEFAIKQKTALVVGHYLADVQEQIEKVKDVLYNEEGIDYIHKLYIHDENGQMLPVFAKIYNLVTEKGNSEDEARIWDVSWRSILASGIKLNTSILYLPEDISVRVFESVQTDALVETICENKGDTTYFQLRYPEEVRFY